MGELAGLVSAGGAGVLALVVVYLLASNRQDRQQYEQAIDRAETRANTRADAAEERARAARELAEEARKARYGCEEAAAAMRAELAALRRLDGQP